MTRYRYRADVLGVLLEHGIRPTHTTPPAVVHELLSDLYRFELRRLRSRLVRKEIPREGYRDRVIALRRRYPLLSVNPDFWLEAGDAEPPVQSGA